MSDTVIRVENLSKKYVIGHEPAGGYWTLRDVVTNAARRAGQRLQHPFNGAAGSNNNKEEFWALKDVSFDIKQGDVLGIIGRNGAGKSTLLKILSRITEPTTGCVRVKGRVASLLEVGTGFHPELTGRENVYLNGAILGMSKAEIARKFDEIVAFAEVEKFLDTPVKRYSSGMYIRLAFAVAAHLEPEILIIDEVLAVGDAEFQSKCLGKMGEASKQSRTILFVSHNMQAIQSLCSTAIQLDHGQIINQGTPQSVVSTYLALASTASGELRWTEGEAPGNEEVKLIAIRVGAQTNSNSTTCSSKDDIFIEMEFQARTKNPALCVGFDLVTSAGVVVARSYQTDMSAGNWPLVQVGLNRWRCLIPKGLLNAGVYYVCPKIGMHCQYWIVNLDAVLQFEVVLDHGVSPFWNVLDQHNRPGIIAPILQWNDRFAE